MIKIILFENQRWQFKVISEKLSFEGFEVLPNDTEYFDFIEHVRVALNNRYKPERKNSAYKYILDYIEKNQPLAIVMDHKIVGSYQSENGIDLALKIRRSTSLISKIPIVFLSRTLQNETEVIEFINKNKINAWVSKGYAGQAILDDDTYFKNVFVFALKNAISGKNYETVTGDLKFLLSLESLKESVKDEITRFLQMLKGVTITMDMVSYIARIKTKKSNVVEADILMAHHLIRN